MKCPQCQHQNPPGAKSCDDCGARLPHECRQRNLARPMPTGRSSASKNRLTSEVTFERGRLGRLVEPYTPEKRLAPRWLLLGLLATAIVGVLGVAFLSGTELLARYAAKGFAPVHQPPEQTEPDDPAALARPLPQSSPDPASTTPPAQSVGR
jgi:hypothetical protein